MKSLQSHKLKVVIPASGKGTRLGGKIPKQFQLLGDKPILYRTIAAFHRFDSVAEIAVAVPQGYIPMVQDYGFDKVCHIIEGGSDRQSSVFKALKCLSAGGVILIHDGARPFVSEETINNVAQKAIECGAAIAGVPVTDTIKKVNTNGSIIETPNRNHLWQAQTPQGFTYDIIMRAHTQYSTLEATDDSMLVELLGIPVYIVSGATSNIKITTPEDFAIAKEYLRKMQAITKEKDR